MLVLSRKPSQKILVGDITVTVVRIGPGSVRLGIEAPRGVPVVREELVIELGCDKPRPLGLRHGEGND